MNIWIINHYAVPTKYYPLARPATFAKYLMQEGHEVTIFAASTVHGSSKNLIEDNRLYKEEVVDNIHYVYVRDCTYNNNGIKRILNMVLFPPRLKRASKNFSSPDVVLAVSATPMACMMGINLAHKYNCKGIAEIADLWPESFVAYEIISKKNPLLYFMYAYEKHLYKKADEIIFTMEGGKDYIIEKGWDLKNSGSIDLKKVHHINNGVDLEVFDKNKAKYKFEDSDLDDIDTFKVVYTGSIRRVNNLGILVDTAEKLQKLNPKIRLIVFGDGDERKILSEKAKKKGLSNILFKGKVKKEAIPYVLSKADLCLLHWEPSAIEKYGMSMNKLFEYLASGKPILANSKPAYDLIERYQCGWSNMLLNSSDYAKAIAEIAQVSVQVREQYGVNARKVAMEYDFKQLTNRLIKILEL